MTVAELNSHFGLPGVLAFDSASNGMARAQVTLPTCTATVYLHGAHLTHWQPVGQEPAIFLSGASEFAPGKAIRGGIPVCWPWFGPRSAAIGSAGTTPGNVKSPSHGFARLADWAFAHAALIPGGPTPAGEASADTLRLVFRLEPSELSRGFGFPAFALAYELIFGADAGRCLTLRLATANPGPASFTFEEALHTYFCVGDVRKTTLAGLEGATYLDKTDDFKQKSAPRAPLGFAAMTDSVFPNSTVSTEIRDGARNMRIAKSGSATTVVWNPWAEGSATLADLEHGVWPRFLCVETANTGGNAVTLAAGENHLMEARITSNPI